MATGGGNLYPNWLGSASLTIPTNTINTNVSVVTQAGVSTYTTRVNVVPDVLLSYRSTTTLDTNNPSELLTYTVPASGWYMTCYNGVASHASGSNWTSIAELNWYVTKNNSVQSNTQFLVEPQYISGYTVSEFISINGGGIVQANTGDSLQWVCDANALSPISAGFSGGFGFITLQKIA